MLYCFYQRAAPAHAVRQAFRAIFNNTFNILFHFLCSLCILRGRCDQKCRKQSTPRSTTGTKFFITTSTIKPLLVALSGFLLFIPCKKEAPPCTGSCRTINANGQVINKLTNASASDVPVSLSWVKFVGGFSQFEVITTVRSKSDGTFSFTSTVDATYFTRGYFLGLNVGSNNEYIVLGYSGMIEARAYSYDPNTFQNIQFEVYKKANLKIRLHRTQNDSFASFSISHSNVGNDVFIYDYNVQSPQEVIDQNKSEININTVANVYTRIKVVKSFSNGTSNMSLDSVKCSANSTSLYDVNF